VDAAGEFAQLVQSAGHAGGDAVEFGGELALIGGHAGLGGAQLQNKRDQSLLGAVVQVAFDAAAGLVGGDDDARARGGQLGVGLGIGESGCDQFGEAGQPGFGVHGERLLAGRRDDYHAPQPSFDVDRRGHREADAPLAGDCCGVPGGVRIAGYPGRPLGGPHRRRHTLRVDADRGREIGRVSTACPAAHVGELAALTVVAADDGVIGQRQQLPDLTGHRAEHDTGRRGMRHQRGHPPQRSLFGGQRGQLVPAALERFAHHVERSLEGADLTHPGLRQSRRQIAAGQSFGHGRRPPRRSHDRARHIAGVHRDQCH
jgi:hypothetical protein